MFFASEKDLKAKFISRYVDSITKWEAMSDTELAEWYDRLQNDMAEFAVCTYDSGD